MPHSELSSFSLIEGWVDTMENVLSFLCYGREKKEQTISSYANGIIAVHSTEKKMNGIESESEASESH